MNNIEDLKRQILEFHPEITAKNINLDVSFNQEVQKYEVRLNKDGKEFGAFLEKQDADDCLAGKKCLSLAVLVAQLLAELENLLSPRRPG
jgi:hypothetical protein|uniref:Uncharacterized protein n=1 Tax=Desulfobacca acetoxidans TaxID=60893 RepID=A0A7C3Z431_9BACT